MRELRGMQPITMFEFTGQRLANVLAEVAIWAAGEEAQNATLMMTQHWNEEDGFVIYVYRNF